MNKTGFFVLAACAGLGAAEPSLTVYNDHFAVVRETVPLELEAGVNRPIHFNRATRQLEPDSVMLRDPAGQAEFRILEQSYRNDPVTRERLLELCEGETIRFEQRFAESIRTVSGRVVRSGYRTGGQPLIETGGELRFSLPGEPLFPALKGGTVLEPTLSWVLFSPVKQSVQAEVAYLTGGLGWEASYNLVAPEEGDRVELSGWVTLRNQCGQQFENAQIKLMAGDVNKLRPQADRGVAFAGMRMALAEAPPEVTEKAFDEFHLYTLPTSLTLHDQETKQVEFIRAKQVLAERVYVYDGAAVPAGFRGYAGENRSFGMEMNPKVQVLREFKNEEANGLGLPLPAGRVRFYRQDAEDGRVEFTGENRMDHTPRGETVRLFTGHAFDLIGERRQTDYRLDQRAKQLEESFEIKVRNRKEIPVRVMVRERFYRWPNAEITAASTPFRRVDPRTAEASVEIPPDGEVVLTYQVRYTW